MFINVFSAKEILDSLYPHHFYLFAQYNLPFIHTGCVFPITSLLRHKLNDLSQRVFPLVKEAGNKQAKKIQFQIVPSLVKSKKGM